jgi:integrase/recombinase XerC
MLNKFLQYLKVEKQYSPLTIQTYENSLQAYQKYLSKTDNLSLFDNVKLNNIDYRSLRNWIRELLTAGISRRTVAKHLAAIRTYFQYWKKNGVAEQNPAVKIKLPPIKRKLPSFLKENETENLFENVEFPATYQGMRDKCMLEILYGCGIRRSELILLKFQDIDFSQSVMYIYGKGKKTRIVPFGNHVKKAILDYIEVANSEGINIRESIRFFVTKSQKEVYPKMIYEIVEKYLSLVSNAQKKGPHTLRHTYATHLLNKGADLNDIKELLGHSSLAATQMYTHNSISKLKNIHKIAHPRAEKKE